MVAGELSCLANKGDGNGPASTAGCHQSQPPPFWKAEGATFCLQSRAVEGPWVFPTPTGVTLWVLLPLPAPLSRICAPLPPCSAVTRDLGLLRHPPAREQHRGTWSRRDGGEGLPGAAAAAAAAATGPPSGRALEPWLRHGQRRLGVTARGGGRGWWARDVAPAVDHRGTRGPSPLPALHGVSPLRGASRLRGSAVAPALGADGRALLAPRVVGQGGGGGGAAQPAGPRAGHADIVHPGCLSPPRLQPRDDGERPAAAPAGGDGDTEQDTAADLAAEPGAGAGGAVQPGGLGGPGAPGAVAHPAGAGGDGAGRADVQQQPLLARRHRPHHDLLPGAAPRLRTRQG